MKKISFSLYLLLLLAFKAGAFEVDTIAIPSKANGIAVKAIVILPDKAVGENAVKCPVLYLLHGYSGDETNWLGKKTNLPEIADEKGIIIVCPDGKNSWYLDSPLKKDNQYETFISYEMIEYVDNTYSTIPDRNHRAITGLSMGGHGALYNAFKHKDVFGAVGSMSGAIDVNAGGKNYELNTLLQSGANGKTDWGDYSVIAQVNNLQNNDLAISFDCGIDDFCFFYNEALHKALVEKKIDHDYTVRPGVHSWKYWINSIDFHILFFCNYFSLSQ
jgi:S-formylglutathione hydrolase FrmB